MFRRPARTVGLVAPALLALLVGMPNNARALTTVEGAAIGDQGFFWTTPAESWIFPHRLGNIDNRVMLQVWNNSGFINAEPIQMAFGGGFVLELADNLNLGLWLSSYDPGLGGMVDAGVAATGWNTFVGDPAAAPNETAGLQNVDPYAAGAGAGRKIDLFASYWLSDLDVETGLHLWWGSGHRKLEPDDSTGPIDIDADSDPATPGDPANDLGVDSLDDKLTVEEGTYALSDFGLGLGAGYRGIEGLRADLGFDFNILGVSWEPNGLSDYVDAGGSAFGVNLRTHYDMSDKWTLGGFVRFKTNSFGLEPLVQRDGGDLQELYKSTDPDDLGQLPDPTGNPPTTPGVDSDPTYTGNEPFPSNGIKYEAGGNNIQLAALLRYRPISTVALYGALGFQRTSAKTKTSIGGDWYAESVTSSMALPFINIGFEGQVFSHLDVLLGATKRWAGSKTTTTFFDDRIPTDDLPQGAPSTSPTPVPGQEDHTNNNRREISRTTDTDNALTSATALMLGTRIHYGPLQLVGHMNPEYLLSGTALLSGSTPASARPSGSPYPGSIGYTWLWVSLIYDWDFDMDTDYGNGTMFPVAKATSPHQAEPPADDYAPVRDNADDSYDAVEESVPTAPEPEPEPVPEETTEPVSTDYEEFDS